MRAVRRRGPPFRGNGRSAPKCRCRLRRRGYAAFENEPCVAWPWSQKLTPSRTATGSPSWFKADHERGHLTRSVFETSKKPAGSGCFYALVDGIRLGTYPP